MIDGRKELALNRARAARFYQEEFDDHARAYRDHVTRADIFNGVAGNMANVLMLALIGVLFYLASGLGWASANTASVFALTILLLRTPLIGAVAALPTLLAARVSLKKLAGLQLAEGNTDFAPKGESLAGFKQLSLKGACYRYPDQDGVAGFEVGPLLHHLGGAIEHVEGRCCAGLVACAAARLALLVVAGRLAKTAHELAHIFRLQVGPLLQKVEAFLRGLFAEMRVLQGFSEVLAHSRDLTGSNVGPLLEHLHGFLVFIRRVDSNTSFVVLR